MSWLQKRVWQLGIGTLLVIIGVVLVYTAGVGEPNDALIWTGLVLAWVGLAVPLASKALGFGKEEEDDEAKNDNKGTKQDASQAKTTEDEKE